MPPPLNTASGYGDISRRRRRSYRAVPNPYTPPMTRPPAGTYDPGIDAQVGAAGRGLQDLRIDTEVQGGRLNEDFDFQAGQYGRDRDRAVFDFGRGHSRALEDLLASEYDVNVSESRGRQDIGTAKEDVSRNYQRLGQQQSQASSAMGSSQAMAGRQSQTRGENQGREQSRLDLSLNRLLEDVSEGRRGIQRGRQRANENFDTGVGRVHEDFASGMSGLSRGRDRGVEDLALGLGRAEREGSFFDLDAANQRFYQAAAMGYEPPPPQSPKGARTLRPRRRR